MRRLTLVMLVLLAVGGAVDAGLAYNRFAVVVSAAGAPTPSPGAMTIYEVQNPNAAPLLVSHEIQNVQLTPVFTFSDTVPASASAQYHVRDMPAIPTSWTGQVVLSADQPFTANVAGYDYVATATPTNSPTATATASRTATTTASPTRTATPTSTSTPTPFRTVVPLVK
jgi:hypothetical protein